MHGQTPSRRYPALLSHGGSLATTKTCHRLEDSDFRLTVARIVSRSVRLSNKTSGTHSRIVISAIATRSLLVSFRCSQRTAVDTGFAGDSLKRGFARVSLAALCAALSPTTFNRLFEPGYLSARFARGHLFSLPSGADLVRAAFNSSFLAERTRSTLSLIVFRDSRELAPARGKRGCVTIAEIDFSAAGKGAAVREARCDRRDRRSLASVTAAESF